MLTKPDVAVNKIAHSSFQSLSGWFSLFQIPLTLKDEPRLPRGRTYLLLPHLRGRDRGWSIHLRCEGSTVLFFLFFSFFLSFFLFSFLFLLPQSPEPSSNSGSRLLPISQSRLLLRCRENTSAGFWLNLAVGTFSWYVLYPIRAHMYLLSLVASPTNLLRSSLSLPCYHTEII